MQRQVPPLTSPLRLQPQKQPAGGMPDWLGMMQKVGPQPAIRRAFQAAPSAARTAPTAGGGAAETVDGAAAPMGAASSACPPAAPSAEAILETKLKEACARGEAEGRTRGEAQGRALFEQALARLTAVTDEIVQTRGQLQTHFTEQVASVAMLVAEAILGPLTEREGAGGYALRVAREGLALLGGGEPIVLRIAPEDLPLFEAHRDQLASSAEGPPLSISADPRVERGCVLETPRFRIDATIAARLRSVAAALVPAE